MMMNDTISAAISAIEEALAESQSRTETAQIYAELRLGLEEKLKDTMDWYDKQDNAKEK